MNSRLVTWIVLAVLSLALAYGCFLVLRPFFSEVFLALVLAIVFYPAYHWLERKTGRPGLAAWICTLGTGVLFLFPVTMLGVAISQETKHAIDAVNAAIGPDGTLEWFDRAISFISAKLGWETNQTKEFLQGRLSGFSASLLSNAVKSLQGLGSWLFSSIITLITMFFLFRGGASCSKKARHGCRCRQR